MIRCKFKIDNIERFETTRDGKPVTIASIRMSPVMAGSEENAKFWAATPSGSLAFETVNAGAIEHLQIGGEYYLDLSQVGA